MDRSTVLGAFVRRYYSFSVHSPRVACLSVLCIVYAVGRDGVHLTLGFPWRIAWDNILRVCDGYYLNGHHVNDLRGTGRGGARGRRYGPRAFAAFPGPNMTLFLDRGWVVG